MTAAFTAAQFIPAPDWLFSRTGTLVIESNPQGVEVLVNGKPQGVTPLTLKVEAAVTKWSCEAPASRRSSTSTSHGAIASLSTSNSLKHGPDANPCVPASLRQGRVDIIEGSRWLPSDPSVQFAPLRPAAPRVAAVPYDVVDTEEARALAAGNPLSFLHVSRAEIDLPAASILTMTSSIARPPSDIASLKREAPLVQEAEPSLYLYHLDFDGHGQTGVAACYSLAEYDSDVIKKHERTRKDKEDDRTRHMVELRAQTGPVFLTYRPKTEIDEIAKRVRFTTEPLVDFEALDGVRHAIWRVDSTNAPALCAGVCVR